MCLAQGPQRSDAGEAQTRGPSVSSPALYHEPLRSQDHHVNKLGRLHMPNAKYQGLLVLEKKNF